MFASNFREGIAWFTSNNEGYNNTFDYKKNTDIAVLMMGSSNMLGVNVLAEYNAANLLHNISGKTMDKFGN